MAFLNEIAIQRPAAGWLPITDKLGKLAWLANTKRGSSDVSYWRNFGGFEASINDTAT